MYCKKKILAIIPARGGSKGIYLKNLIKFNGLGLFEHIKICLEKVKIKIDKIVVSTDHKKIIKKAEKLGFDVPFKRPKNLSGDRVSIAKVIMHAIKFIEKKERISYDIIVVLEPTCPLREPRIIERAIKEITKKKLHTVWSISETDNKYHPLKQLIVKKNNLTFFSKTGKKIIARQQLKKMYHRNGAVYVISADYFKKTGKILGDKNGYILSKNFLISIDTMFDVKIAEAYINNVK